ncbi:class I SAM-dependent methyltransferase [Lentzea sp. NPDC004789]
MTSAGVTLSLSTSGRIGLVSLAAMASALRLVPGMTRTIADTTRSLGVARRHDWLVPRWLRVLARHDVVELDGDVYRVRGEVPGAGIGELDLLHELLGTPPEVALLHLRALAHLPELLRDEVTAAQLLGPGSTELGALAGEGRSALTRELDAVCAELVRRAALRCGPSVRVVELGCGAGRLTAAVLRESPDLTRHYRFTDLAGQPLGAETLDVNEDFRAQGFPDAAADVVVAGHTLHHAVNICRALTRIRDLLVPGGELVLTTPTEDDPVALTSTHFLHSPPRGGTVLRGGDVFPSGRAWQTALRAAGFEVSTQLWVGSRSSARQHLFHAVREPV